MLDPRKLRLLHEFAHRGSIAAVADSLDYTASAVSQQLAALEKEAGVALLDRTARSAALTDAGEHLVAHATQILAAIEAAEADLAAREQVPSGQVVVSSYPTAAVAFAPPVARQLRNHTKLTLALRQADAAESLAQLRSGDVDVALIDDWTGVRRPKQSQTLSFHRLCHDPLVLVMPEGHRLAAAESVHLSELADESWIATLKGEPSRHALDSLLRASGSAPTLQWEFEGLDTVLTLVARGLGITVAPKMAVSTRFYRVETRELPPPAAGRDVYAAHRTASADRPAVQEVVRSLYSAAEKLT